MQGATPPVDLHESLSVPLPVLVICALLGVPYEDRAQFRAWSEGASNTVSLEQSTEAWGKLVAYMRGLVQRKRTEPGDDLITDLLTEHGDPLDDEMIAQITAVLLFAGHETTMVRIDFGTVLFLTNPEQRDACRDDESLIPAAVEEILRRSATGGGGGLQRYAREDIQTGDVTVKTSDAVLLAAGAANYDDRAFPGATDFNITRPTNQHLAFGHGARYCIGANLARIELQVVFAALLRRMPTLRLTVSVDELELRVNQFGGAGDLVVRRRARSGERETRAEVECVRSRLRRTGLTGVCAVEERVRTAPAQTECSAAVGFVQCARSAPLRAV
jgi:cytochrome P450